MAAEEFSLADDYEALGDNLLKPVTDEEIAELVRVAEHEREVADFTEAMRAYMRDQDTEILPLWFSRLAHARGHWADPRSDPYVRMLREREAKRTLAADLEAEEASGLLEGALLQGLTFASGGSFVLDTTAVPSAVWGYGNEVIWAEGESLIIAGGEGLGKTTLAQQAVLGGTGCTSYSTLLGYPIMDMGRVLYLAMDRPRQAARSMARMVTEADRKLLDERLAVWHGPPPDDFATSTGTLLRLAKAAGANTVVVDSIKDAAIGLAKDEVGAGYNRARQRAIDAGIQVLELHHTRKPEKGVRPVLADIYGSKWITAGAGSVLLLDGSAGDPIVTCYHVKFPADEIGPLTLVHDHPKGRTDVHLTADLVSLAYTSGALSAQDAAKALYSTSLPSRAQVEKARRKLDQLTEGTNPQLVIDKTTTPHVWRLNK
jgi:replicative DNA helicase